MHTLEYRETFGGASVVLGVSASMTAAATVVVLFGMSCADPCLFGVAELATLEQAVVREIAARGFEVRPAPDDVVRPTDSIAAVGASDHAKRLGVARVVVLDVELKTRRIWITHFVRGTVGPWGVVRHHCVASAEEACPGLMTAVARGLRPRHVDDVDFLDLLSGAASDVGACVHAEDRVPVAFRIFGRVELDIEVTRDGNVRVAAIAPARVARAELGRCLREAFQKHYVGPFEGEAVHLRVPLDL